MEPRRQYPFDHFGLTLVAFFAAASASSYLLILHNAAARFEYTLAV